MISEELNLYLEITSLGYGKNVNGMNERRMNESIKIDKKSTVHTTGIKQ
jgi:hypothetical protein